MIEIKSILCAVDFTECSRQAARQAVVLARWYEARLTVLYVFQNVPALDLPPMPLDKPDRARLLADLPKFVGDVPPDLKIDWVVEEAESVPNEIRRKASEIHADLVVVGSHGRTALGRMFLGSVAERALQTLHCPTLVVPQRTAEAALSDPPRFRKLLCAVDFSDSSLGALTYAFRLAEENDSALTLLHVVEIPPDLKELLTAASLDSETLRRTAERSSRERLEQLVPDAVKAYCTVKVDVVAGRADKEIVSAAAAAGSDVIIMGVSGRRSVGALMLGSNTARVARQAGCPVLVVRS